MVHRLADPCSNPSFALAWNLGSYENFRASIGDIQAA
jgi:hypothetical protein